MDFVKGLKSRRSIRKFKKIPVPRITLNRVFELAKWAPGAKALRAWSYLVVTGKKRDEAVSIISQNTAHLWGLLDGLDEIGRDKTVNFYKDLGGAPVIIFILVPKLKDQWQRKNLIASAASAGQTLLYSIHSRELGACFITIAAEVERNLKKELAIDSQREIILGVAVGVPAEEPHVPHREVDSVEYID